MEKKKMIKIAVAVLIIIGIASAFIWLDYIPIERGSCGDNLKWSINSKGYVTVSGTGELKDTGETNRWWKQDIEATSLKIKEGITAIGDNAFDSWESLESIKLPSTLKSIGRQAFSKCKKLKHIEIPEGVEYIGEYAFEDCISLQDIKIPKSVTKMQRNTFEGCLLLLPVNVDEMNDSFASKGGLLYNKDMTALISCPYLFIEVDIPEGVKQIQDEAFLGNSLLEKVKLPEGLTSIGSSAFENCGFLSSINIPSSVNDIGERAFNKCDKLTKIKIPEGITEIKAYTFAECSDLTEIVLPSSLLKINLCAFTGSSITSIFIPEKVWMVSPSAFYDCQLFSDIMVADNNMVLMSQDGVLYDKKMTELKICPYGKTGTFVIPDGVKKIGEEAFGPNLSRLEIPRSVDEISEFAFLDASEAPDFVVAVYEGSQAEEYFKNHKYSNSDNIKYEIIQE